MGEAEVEQVLRPLMESSVNPTLAPYGQAGEVRLRLTARAADRAEASALCDGLEKAIRARLSAPAFTAPTYRTWKPDLSASCGSAA
ncbi:MAG: hypothetical protein L6V84_01430 [Oscillospiraceae bacterium]|nr:MAG: hypothetical protein L6V84_01430 [Oscillospiraceae bacterium]